MIQREQTLGLDKISGNYNLKLEWIPTYPDKPWCWGCILEYWNSSKFNLEWIKKFNKEIDFRNLSCHDNLTLNILQEYPTENWMYKHIRLNVDNYYSEKCRDYMAAYKIKQWWKKILYDPRTKVGNKFVESLYLKNII